MYPTAQSRLHTRSARYEKSDGSSGLLHQVLQIRCQTLLYIDGALVKAIEDYEGNLRLGRYFHCQVNTLNRCQISAIVQPLILVEYGFMNGAVLKSQLFEQTPHDFVRVRHFRACLLISSITVEEC